MQIFPTRYSLLSAPALNDFIQAQYGFKETTCRLLIHNVSDVYLIESQSTKYIFKVYRDAHRKLDEIEGELELLDILKEKGAKVSYPLFDVEGNKVQAINAAEGTRHGVLFSFAPGKVSNELTEENIRTIGREMATVHNITANLELKHRRGVYDANTTITEPIQTLKPAFETIPDVYEYLITTGEKIAAKINSFDTNQFSYGMCHYDFLPKNFHFDEAGKITFFDFDFAGYGMLANDIASFYAYFFIEVFMQRRMTQQKADELFGIFISAYREIRPLSEDEVKSIPYFGFGFWVFYLGFQYENFEDWSNMFFGPNYLKGRVALIKQWVDWYCEV